MKALLGILDTTLFQTSIQVFGGATPLQKGVRMAEGEVI